MTCRHFGLFLAALLLPTLCIAHPGGLDAQGGHNDRKNGGYHYHRERDTSGAAEKPAYKENLSGVVTRVKDGDTLVLKTRDGDQYNIRLYGIDAPEIAQRFGKESKQRLTDLVDGKQVQVRVTDTDRYGRKVAAIFLPDQKTSVNETMVAEGLAWWYAKYARKDEALKKAEAEARESKRGLWIKPNPLPPWEYRK